MKKRMLSVLLALCLVLTLLPVTALAAEGTESDPYTSIAEYNAAVKDGAKNGQDVYLTIEGTPDNPVEFDADNPFNIANMQSQVGNPPKLHLTLKYCSFTGQTGDDANPSFMYLSNCQSLVIENCTFDPAGDKLTYGINWNLIDIQDATVSIRDCHFKGTYKENAIKLNQRGGADDTASDIKGHNAASIASAEITNCTFEHPRQAIILLGSAGKNNGAAAPSTGAFPVTITAGESGAYVFQAYNASEAEAYEALTNPDAALESKLIISLADGETGTKDKEGDFGTEDDFVARIVGGFQYTSLSNALRVAASAGGGVTIQLQQDASIGTDTIPAGVTVSGDPCTLTVKDGATLTVAGSLYANNVVGESENTKLVVKAGAMCWCTDPESTAGTYVWSYRNSSGSDDVTQGKWLTKEADLVGTAQYWMKKVQDSETNGVYSPEWKALRNLNYFYNLVKDYTDPYAERVAAIGTFITGITKLDMSDKEMIAGGDGGILSVYTGLEELNLSNTGIMTARPVSGGTSDDLGGLENMTGLKVLNLSDNAGITNVGGLGNMDFVNTLESLDISGTGVTDMGFMWADGDTAKFPSLTTLTAKNLELTDISGLSKIASKAAEGTTWDLSGGTLTDSSDNNAGYTQIQAIKTAFANVTGGATFKEPVYQSSGSSGKVASYGSNLYTTLAAALNAAKDNGGTVRVITTAQQTLSTAIPSGVILQIPNNASVKIEANDIPTVFGDSKGAIQVEAGGTLNVATGVDTAEDFVGGSSARLNLSDGTVLFDIGAQEVTLKSGAQAEIPSGKQFWLLLQTGATDNDRVPMDGIIETGATLTVNGTLTLPSLTDGSSLTVNGTVDAANGTFELGKQSSVTVASAGSVSLNGADLFQKKILGTATVENGGTLTIGGTEMVGPDGNLVMTSGQLKLDMGQLDETNGKIVVTFENAEVEIPADKQWTTVIGQDPYRINMDVVIDTGSTLTVSGKAGTGDNEYGFRVANGSAVTLNGTISLAAGSIMDISTEGTITGNGNINVRGTLNDKADTAASFGVTADLLPNGQVNANADISAKLTNAEARTAADGYQYSWGRVTPVQPEEPEEPEQPVTPPEEPSYPDYDDDDDDDGYGITIPASTSIRGGSITVSPRSADKGETVTITVKPDAGYVLDELSVTARSGGTVALTRKNDSQYTFRMPGSSVVIDVSFVQEGTAPAEEMNFTDVPESFWAYSEIRWAFDNGYMNGTTASTFSPAGTVSRQQVWMILARMSGADPADMAAAKAWAVENGISDGTNPGGAVTRQQLVALLYRFASRNDYDTSARADLSGYPDGASVASYAAEPMAWAVADGIIGGTTTGTLNPAGPSNRAQLAVILWRFYQTTAD